VWTKAEELNLAEIVIIQLISQNPQGIQRFIL
jgi:hypothetical protein